MVMLMPTMKEALALMPGGTSRTDKDGNFTLSGVAPGEYSLQVQSLAALMNAASQAMSMIGGGEAGTRRRRRRSRWSASSRSATVTVAGEDITGLIDHRHARREGVAARLVFEGGREAREADVAAAHRRVHRPRQHAGARRRLRVGRGARRPATFEIDGLVGGRVFRFVEPAERLVPQTHHPRERGRHRQGIRLQAGRRRGRLRDRADHRTQTVTGSVTNDKSEPVKEYTVVVFPEDPSKWTVTATRWRASARPDQQGQFKIADLPPGRVPRDCGRVRPRRRMDGSGVAVAGGAGRPRSSRSAKGPRKTLDLKLAGS